MTIDEELAATERAIAEEEQKIVVGYKAFLYNFNQSHVLEKV